MSALRLLMSRTAPFAKKILLQSKHLASGLRNPRKSRDDSEERERLVDWESLSERAMHHQSLPPQPKAMGYPTSDPDDVALLQRYAQIVREFLSSLPFPYLLLRPEDVELKGNRPVAAGGTADIFKVKHNGRGAVLKAHRYYRLCDITQVVARFCNEIDVYTLLRDGRVDVVLLLGVYSNNTCPFGLVYRYMENLDVTQYLKNEPNVGRVELLARIARCLNGIHDLEIVHGDFRAANILVDKDGTPHIAGLSNASILSRSTDRKAEDGMSTDRLSRSHQQELTWRGMSSNMTSATHPTKAGDMLTFGFVAFEILTGRPPFFGMAAVTTAYSILNGDRPPRPNQHDLSDLMWQMIQSCWNPVASSRMPIEEAVILLEEELNRIAILEI